MWCENFLWELDRNAAAYGTAVTLVLFFFFQAEDGIRDHCVTGVQTCALPISLSSSAGDTLRQAASTPSSCSAKLVSRCVRACLIRALPNCSSGCTISSGRSSLSMRPSSTRRCHEHRRVSSFDSPPPTRPHPPPPSPCPPPHSRATP